MSLWLILISFIQRWRDGDERAAEAIYNQCCSQTLRLCYLLLDNTADAEEVTQDALTYALLNIAKYDPQRATFNTWLYRITVSRCRNKHRRRWLPTFSLADWLQAGGDKADPQPDPERQALQQSSQDEVWAAVQMLSQPLREAVVLRYWLDYSFKEIGQVLGCPPRTAQSRVRLAYERLSKSLDPAHLIIMEDSIL